MAKVVSEPLEEERDACLGLIAKTEAALKKGLIKESPTGTGGLRTSGSRNSPENPMPG